MKPNSTQVPNKIVDLLITGKLTVEQSRVLMFICRKTIGWNKETDWITYGYFEKYLGISKGNLSPVINKLIEKKLVVREKRRDGSRLKCYYSLHDTVWSNK